MPNRSRSQSLDDNSDEESLLLERTLGEQHLDTALGMYQPRLATGHAASIRAIEFAVCEVVDEKKRHHDGPVAVILAVKERLAMYPASASIHAVLVRRCIERYYE